MGPFNKYISCHYVPGNSSYKEQGPQGDPATYGHDERAVALSRHDLLVLSPCSLNSAANQRDFLPNGPLNPPICDLDLVMCLDLH